MNTKEQQTQTLYLDYGFRQMDPQLGRWHVIDAMAEKYFSSSPYAYVENDPVNRTDFMGLTNQWQNPDNTGELNNWLNGGGIMDFINNLNNRLSAGFNHGSSFYSLETAFRDTYTNISGKWVEKSYLTGAYFWDKGTNTLQLYSKNLDNWILINLGKAGASVKRNNDGTTNWSNILDYTNKLATVAGFLALAEKGLKWNDLGHTATYGMRGLSGRIHSAEIVTRFNRIQALRAAKWFKIGGYIAGGVGVVAYAFKGINQFIDGNYIDATKSFLDASMSAVFTFGGIPGFILGGAYFVVDGTIGWPEMGKRMQQNMQNNPYWWRTFAH
ncbi:MAG: hypothetical protein GXO80_03745 [Chlorobi bacterium]|nr:hypothetical protein [Chlorobiota bacterium]